MACLIVQIKLKKRTRPSDEHETEGEKKRVAPESGLARGLLFALEHMPRAHTIFTDCVRAFRTNTRCSTHLRYDYNLIYSFFFVLFSASVERQ